MHLIFFFSLPKTRLPQWLVPEAQHRTCVRLFSLRMPTFPSSVLGPAQHTNTFFVVLPNGQFLGQQVNVQSVRRDGVRSLRAAFANRRRLHEQESDVS